MSISDEEVFTILVRVAQETDPVVRVIEKYKDPTTNTYHLVLGKGKYDEKIVISQSLVRGWLEEGDRTKEAEIRRIVIAAVDALDLRDLKIKETYGLWDWTGDEQGHPVQ
jgi:hypothetical protein